MIQPNEVNSSDEDLARRVIAYARTIAPCLDSLQDGDGENDPKPRSDAIAILKGLASDVRQKFRGVKSQRSGSSAAEYFDGSAFSSNDVAALRALCGAVTSAGIPVGSFPRPSRALTRMWPEDC